MISQLLSPVSSAINYASYTPQLVIPGLRQENYVVLAAAIVRIYHAQLDNKAPEWCYSRMKGILVFGKDVGSLARPSRAAIGPDNHWFRLLDIESGKPIWMFMFPNNFTYAQEQPFFHVLQGMSRRFGFLFDDDDEASTLALKVISQTGPPRPTKHRTLSLLTIRRKPSNVRKPLISAPIISLPTPHSFVHAAHVGLNKDGIIEATNGIDPCWRALLEGSTAPNSQYDLPTITRTTPEGKAFLS